MLTLNQRALAVAERLESQAADLRITPSHIARVKVLDCGVHALGGIEAGLALARVCLADLADVALLSGDASSLESPRVQICTDQPVLACMAAQYAGWQISVGKYFAMGSGPMRAIYGKEKLFDDIPGRETARAAVGALETGKLPTEDVIAYLAERLRLPAESIILLAARTASIAGTIQVVARSLEMALHKLHELKFDLKQVISGMGVAPLPPPAKDDLAAIGRTNDAILYGGKAIVWVQADDDQLAEIGPKVPSSASPEFGALFGELFARYKDFYKIDPMLFSPAQIILCNLRSGRMHQFGRIDAEVLRRSFER
ncbi:MAG TPA: methenyltetrahydromethanopterin cyclohydrolase [Gemmataceae bacterium]|jgi:methenyltetrahydromethanopterin cyclohydrolase|nr:methenyltetrahydromethanopterin cyclohydrolase [Gemmataceae bacterium]